MTLSISYDTLYELRLRGTTLKRKSNRFQQKNSKKNSKDVYHIKSVQIYTVFLQNNHISRSKDVHIYKLATVTS